jgi:hypothetical protein
MSSTLFIICFFTFLIHITETLAYCLRIAGIRTKKIAVAMSFVTSTLLVSRLSNMFQAPLLGALVDKAVLIPSLSSLHYLETSFRTVILAGFLGSLVGFLLSPSAINLFSKAIVHFHDHGSIPKLIWQSLKPRHYRTIVGCFTLPKLHHYKNLSLKNLPKGFLILNTVVTSVYTIGVLCSLLAGAYLPTMRSTAIQLSGIVNGIATILLTLFVDPAGARITDQAYHSQRSHDDVFSVVFFLQMGRLFGTLVLAQLFFKPFTLYIMWVTQIFHQ